MVHREILGGPRDQTPKGDVVACRDACSSVAAFAIDAGHWPAYTTAKDSHHTSGTVHTQDICHLDQALASRLGGRNALTVVLSYHSAVLLYRKRVPPRGPDLPSSLPIDLLSMTRYAGPMGCGLVEMQLSPSRGDNRSCLPPPPPVTALPHRTLNCVDYRALDTWRRAQSRSP